MMCVVAASASLVAAGISDTTAAMPEESSSNAGTAERTTVVVTAVAPRSPLEFITDTKQPRQPVPASDGADYLKTIAGFNTIRNGGTNGDPVLRGMFGSRLNVLANDGSMPGACPDRMDNTLSYVSPETYDLLLVTKGPQTVRWGPGASAGTIRFERKSVLDDIDRPSLRMNANALGGSFGRNDQLLDVLGGAEVGYARLSANRSESDDYEDGDGRVVPSRWEKWNADTALGWTPSANTLIELSAGTGDAEARYAGRAMDGAQFERTSYGLRFEQRGLTDSLEAIEANIFYNHTDHVMDNYTLRAPNPMGPMPMAMAKNVDRRTTGGRVAATWQFSELEIVAGIDAQESRQRERSAMGRGRYAQMPWRTQADLSNVGAFAEFAWSLDNSGRVVAGARADRAEATDRRETIGMMPMDNPTAGMARRETLASGFMRYEGQARNTPVSWFAGLGRVERMPDYWELFSADMGPMGSMNAFSALQPEQTTQLDVGVQYRTAKIDAWLSAYAGRIDDFILFTYRMDEMDEMGAMMSMTSVRA